MERLTGRAGHDVFYKGRPLAFMEPCDVRDMAEVLAAFEDTGWTPGMLRKMGENAGHLWDFAQAAETMTLGRFQELAEADKEGRIVLLPCKVGERWVDEDGRAVRITAVIVSMEPFGENINIYFDYEDATPDDAGSDCMTNWYHFSRLFTCAETVLDNRKDADKEKGSE